MVAVLAGCGDALVDGRYRGEPLVTVSGTVISDFTPEELDLTDDGDLEIALDWATLDETQDPPTVDFRTTTAFPARYTLRIYEPPPDAAFFDTPWGPEAEVAIATPVLYVDADGDQRWDAGEERVVGGAHDIVLLYTRRPLAVRPLKEPDSGWSWRQSPAPPPTDSGWDSGYDSGPGRWDSGTPPWGDSGLPTDSGLRDWLPEREPVTLGAGYHKMYSRTDFCDNRPAPVSQLLPASAAPVDLSLGPLWAFLTDWDCDGRIPTCQQG